MSWIPIAFLIAFGLGHEGRERKSRQYLLRTSDDAQKISRARENHAGQREGDRMVDETRSKLVCATVVAIGLLFAIIYANQRIPGGDAAVTASVAR